MVKCIRGMQTDPKQKVDLKEFWSTEYKYLLVDWRQQARNHFNNIRKFTCPNRQTHAEVCEWDS